MRYFVASVYYQIKNLGFILSYPKYWKYRGVKFIGARCISIGRNVGIGYGSWLNVNDRNGRLKIGSSSLVGRFNFFTVGKSIEIGSNFLSAERCSFIGASHEVGRPELPYLKTGTTAKNSILIGNNVFMGFNASIVGNVSVGDCVVIGAHALVTKDIDSYTMVVGAPAKVVKKFCFQTRMWVRPEEVLRDTPDNNYVPKDYFLPIGALTKAGSIC